MLKRYLLRLVVVLLLSLVFLSTNSVMAIDDSNVESNSAVSGSVNERAQVLSSFIVGERGALVESFDERREQHKILFFMGVFLLVSVLTTAGFGVSMAMLGKDVFVPHMIFAGLTVFLAIAHAVVAIVWFYPF